MISLEIIDGAAVEGSYLLPEKRIRECIKLAEEKAGAPIAEIKLSMMDGGDVRVDYSTFVRKFERIRRITGYLVGTIDRWNNAKKSEERERVKHA